MVILHQSWILKLYFVTLLNDHTMHIAFYQMHHAIMQIFTNRYSLLDSQKNEKKKKKEILQLFLVTLFGQICSYSAWSLSTSVVYITQFIHLRRMNVIIKQFVNSIQNISTENEMDL